jgi:F0F1-type ATP synthase delta subunit
MRILPHNIAKALIDAVENGTPVDDACEGALQMLHEHCRGTSMRQFLLMVERELKKRGSHSSGLLIVPHETSIKAETVAKQLSEKSDKHVPIERAIDPSLIGGAVLHVDHTRIDASIKGALHTLLQLCLQPLG